MLDFSLADIPRLKTVLVKGERRGIHSGNLPDLDDHFRHMEQDFVGLPMLCLIHGKLIALIRRKIDIDRHMPMFEALWSAEVDFLIAHLNSRWLLSAADTMAANGSGVRRSNAAVLTAMFHTLQLCETERLALRDARLDPAKVETEQSIRRGNTHIPLWDGIKGPNLLKGDSGPNMLRDVFAVLDEDAVVGPIARALMSRALAGDTLFGRLADLNPVFVPPGLSDLKGAAARPAGFINGYRLVQAEGCVLVVPQSIGNIDLTQRRNWDLPGIIVVEHMYEAVRIANQLHGEQSP